MSILQTVLLGTISSLIATVIWVFVIFLFEFSARKKITFLLEECDSSTRLMLNSVKYTRYLVVLTQVEKLTSLYLQIYNYLKPLNFSAKKRKLMKLLIFNMIRVLNIFKNIEIGYDEDNELKARCEKFQREYLYGVKTNENGEECFLLISISILQELTNRLGIHKAIIRSLKYYNENNEFYKNILDSLIEVNSFKKSFSLDYFMNKEVLTKTEYEKVINKIVKTKRKKKAI